MTPLEDLPESIRKQLPPHLPGSMTQLYPAPMRSAAVLIPLVEQKDGLHILFEIRSKGIRQGGEVCFPGGRISAGEDSARTAVREAAEELLMDASRIRILAPMYSMTGPGGAQVYSWLGLLEGYRGTFSRDEVADVFTLPLSWLFAYTPSIYRGEYSVKVPEDFPWHLLPGGRGYPWQNIPKNYYFYETPGGVIWGMTAELLYHCVRRLKE